MGRIRRGLTYSNVMATLAVFIALGGGAYALSRGEVKSKHIARDAVKAKHTNFGSQGVPMMATFTGLGTGNGGGNYHPVGASGPGTELFNESITPQAFTATGLRVRVYGSGSSAGSREFVLRHADADGPIVTTALGCEVEMDSFVEDCRSNARVRIPEGHDIWFEASRAGTTTLDYAEIGWRALLP